MYQRSSVMTNGAIYLERKTDLGKFSHGNFDFNFNAQEPSVTIVVRVKYKFEKGITPEQQLQFKKNLESAVNGFAHNKAELVANDGKSPAIPIRVILQENNSSYHKTVDVERVRKKPFHREWVGLDLNVGLNSNVRTLAHEFFHILGNYDEYHEGPIMNRLWWHDRRFLNEQHQTLMGTGTQLRERYFDHIARKVSDLTGKQYVPRLANPAPPQSPSGNTTYNPIKTYPKSNLGIRSILKIGDKGSDVLKLQKSLNAQFNTVLKEDGVFGSKTRSQVKRIQGLFGLKKDGIVGPKTLDAVVRGRTTTKSGMTGKPVRELQQMLNTRYGAQLKVDGIFGPKTKTALQKAQKLYGLKANGVFDNTSSIAFTKNPPLLKGGMRGSYVKSIQQGLNAKMGFRLKEDGIYGVKTTSAVKTAQRLYGLKADGIFGPKTRAALQNRTPQLLRVGSKGNSVKELQNILNRNGYSLKADGIFGPKTKAAVYNFQKRNGLSTDGIVGPKTWNVVLSGHRFQKR